jgi:hypothetical protein
VAKDLEEEIDNLKLEINKNLEKDREFIQNIEKLEKNLIKELNDEQRKMAALVPGLAPKLTNYSK